MALTCPQCGTMNPDGNSFCQGCGVRLTPVAQPAAAGPPGAPVQFMGPPPSVPPPSYQSPYYAPSAAAPQAPIHRTPWVLILSAVLGLVVIMAGCGTALAIYGSRNSSSSSTGFGSGLPSPSPAGTPSPVASPSPTTNGPGKATNPTLSVTVPSGWLVANKDSETITLTNPNGDGSVTIGSGASIPSQTAQQNKTTLDKFFTDKYPDTKACPNSKVTTGSIGGESGIFWQLCFTLISGSQSFQAGAPMFAGANADGSVYYAVILLTPVTNMNNFSAEAKPVLASIVWTLK